MSYNLRVVEPGKYMGKNLKAEKYNKHDVLETVDWYAEELLEAGLVREYTPRPKKQEDIEMPKKVKQTKKSTKKPSSPTNPFSE